MARLDRTTKMLQRDTTGSAVMYLHHHYGRDQTSVSSMPLHRFDHNLTTYDDLVIQDYDPKKTVVLDWTTKGLQRDATGSAVVSIIATPVAGHR